MEVDVLSIFLAIITNPGVLLGLTAGIGYLVLKKPLTTVVAGVAKVIVGYAILFVGIDVMLPPGFLLGDLFKKVLGITGYLNLGQAASYPVAIARYGTAFGMVMVVSFVVELLIARVTPLKYVYLTGHEWMSMCGLLVIFFASLGLEGGTLIVVAGVFLALVLILSMALSRPFMENLGARFVYGHTSMLGIHLAAAIGGLFGDPEKRIKEVELPKIIGFLREFSVSSFVILFILFIIMAPLAGIDYFQSLIGAEPWYLGLVLRPAAFACGITVLLYGVRIMVAELVPAFLGIGEKVIPGAIAGLDCPTVFPFNPICVPYFLLVEYAGQVLMTLIVVLLHNPLLPVAVPSIILATFYGGNASIPAEKIGGRTAGLIAAFVHGVLFNLMGSLCGPWVGPEIGMTVGNVDMSSVALISFGIRDFVLGVNPLWSLAMAVFGILLWVAVFAIPYFILHKGMKRLKKAAYLVK